MSILVDRNTRVARPGHHRLGRQLPRRADAGLRHQGRGRRHARAAAGRASRGRCPSSTPSSEAVRETGANAVGHLRAAARSPPTPSSRPPTPGIPLVVAITEGIPILDMVRVKRYLQDQPGVAAARAQLPRRHHPGPVQDRHHARPHPPARPHRRGLPLRHAHLRGGASSSPQLGLGQSTAVGIGGDPVHGTDFIDVLRAASRPTRTPTASS